MKTITLAAIVLAAMLAPIVCLGGNPKDAEEIKKLGFTQGTFAAAVEVAELLPLPGRLATTVVTNDGSFACLTNEAQSRGPKAIAVAGTYPGEIKDSDVFVEGVGTNVIAITWKQPAGVEIAFTRGRDDKLYSEVRGAKGLREAARKGRVIRLVGEIILPVGDAAGRGPTRYLRFICGRTAVCWFDREADSLRWQDIKLVSEEVRTKPKATERK